MSSDRRLVSPALILSVIATIATAGCTGEGTSEAMELADIPIGAPLYSGEAEPKRSPSDIEDGDVATPVSSTDGNPAAGLAPRPGSPGVFKEVEEREGEGIVTFSQLASFTYIEPDPGRPESLKADQIPAAVRALDGQEVTMEGYMIPIDLDADTNRVKTFFLSRNTLACCFGQMPNANELVEIRFDDGVKFLPDILLRVEGKFEVGEQFDEYGYLMSLYRMHGTKLEDPWGK